MKTFLTLRYSCQFKDELFPSTPPLPALIVLTASAEPKMSE